MQDAHSRKSSFSLRQVTPTTCVPPSVTHAVFRNALGYELWGMRLSTSKAMLVFVPEQLAVQWVFIYISSFQIVLGAKVGRDGVWGRSWGRGSAVSNRVWLEQKSLRKKENHYFKSIKTYGEAHCWQSSKQTFLKGKLLSWSVNRAVGWWYHNSN